MSAEELRRLSKPFAPALLAKAKALASQYRLVIQSDDVGGYMGSTLELPTVMGGGKSIAACAADTLEATIGAIALMLEHGDTPPAPAREGKRDQQVNVRLSAEEKSRLETLASREGFRSISDYIRNAALNPDGRRAG